MENPMHPKLGASHIADRGFPCIQGLCFLAL
jgi:hypothetical protein